MLTSLLNLIPSLHHDSKSAAAESDPSTNLNPGTNNNVAITATTATEQPSATGPRKLHVAMIECDSPVPAVAEKFGSYGKIFDRLLTDAAHRVYGRDGIEVETSLWNVVEERYPDEETMKRIDCILVSGSCEYAVGVGPPVIYGY